MPMFPEVVVTVRTLVALVFLTASLGKVRHWLIFQGVLANYRLLPGALIRPIADLLPPLEALLGILLLLGLAAPWPEAGAAVLLLIFATAMGVNLLRGRRDIDCGCFQSALKQTLSVTLVLRNVVLALLLGIAVLPGDKVTPPAAFDGLLAGGVLFIILQSLTILWSIAPAWRRSPQASEGAV